MKQQLVYLCCFVAIAFSTYGWVHGDSQIKANRAEARSQSCRTFEGQHLDEVKRLSSTYHYLVTATPAERHSTIYKIVQAGVGELQRDAASDQDDNGVFVPLYCDRPGVGLPEPDPTVPVIPSLLRPVNRAGIPPLTS